MKRITRDRRLTPEEAAKYESAILFVVILGAAPAIANGIIAGVDHIPPLLLRAGRVLGARGLSTYRHVIIPAALAMSAGSALVVGVAFVMRRAP